MKCVRIVGVGLMVWVIGCLVAGCASSRAPSQADEPGVAQDDVDSMKSKMDQVALDLAAMAGQEELEERNAERADLPSLSLESLESPASDANPIDPPPGRTGKLAESKPAELLATEETEFEAEPLGGRLALLDVPPALTRAEDKAPELAESAGERAARLAREFEAALDEGASDGPSAYRAALAKAGLGAHLDEPPLPPPNLSIAAQPTVEALTDLHETLASHAEDPVAHLDDAVDAAETFSRRVSESANLRISRAELCSRVDGFGQFTPLASNKFLAGRTTPVVLYVEVDHFGYREVERDSTESPARGWASGDGESSPRWNVELSQELELYRANETTPVWTKPAQSVVDTSLNRRRDFHVVHRFDVPASLKLGIYRLKVRMTDSVTSRQDEAILTIQVVTDERLLK